MNDPKSFIASLFDFSFGSFIVPKLIRLMYIVGLIFGGLYSLSLIGIGFASSTAVGFLALIFTPVIFLVMAILTRSYCELILVQFSLLQNVERIAEHVTGSAGPAPGGGPVDGRGIVHSPSGGGPPAAYTPAPSPSATPAPASTVAPTPQTHTPTAAPQQPSSGSQGWGSGGSSGGGWQ